MSMYKFNRDTWTISDLVIELEETSENIFTGTFNSYYDFDFVFVGEDGTLYGTTWSETNQNGTSLEANSFGSPLWIYGYEWGVTPNLTITVNLITMTWSYTENN